MANCQWSLTKSSEDVPATEYRDLLSQLTGMPAVLSDLGLGESPAGIASGIEFVLEGLHQSSMLSRERTEEDQRANAVAISPSGRKALRGARNAADRAERALLEALPIPERQKFVKALSQIAQAAEQLNGDAGKPTRRNVRRRKIGG